MLAELQTNPTTIAVLLGHDTARANMLAQRLSVECIHESVADEFDFVLDAQVQGLLLHCFTPKFETPFMLEFDKKRPAGAGRDPLKRAFAKCRTVVDATAGWGSDSRRLCDLGFSVTMIERHPLVALLLEDALTRSLAYSGRIQFKQGDALNSLTSILPDAVYMDTMYPNGRKKGAKVKKPLQVLRALCGNDSDANELLEVALTQAQKRVVVKRPHFAPELQSDVDFAITSKLVRYDVYLVDRHN